MQVQKISNYQTQQNFEARFKNNSATGIGKGEFLELWNSARPIKNFTSAEASYDIDGHAIVLLTHEGTSHKTIIRGKKAASKKAFIRQIKIILENIRATETKPKS